jgi:hypothetical protein
MEHRNASPGDLAASVDVVRLLEDMLDECSWIITADKVPSSISTGSAMHDAMGIALALNDTGREASIALEVFSLTLQFFNKLLSRLNEVQRERVLNTLGKDAARQLLMLDYAEKLKTAELSGLVDACLRARV